MIIIVYFLNIFKIYLIFLIKIFLIKIDNIYFRWVLQNINIEDETDNFCIEFKAVFTLPAQ